MRWLFFLVEFLTVSRCSAARYEAEASIHWDSFYQQHQNRSGGRERGRLILKKKKNMISMTLSLIPRPGNEATSQLKDSLYG